MANFVSFKENILFPVFFMSDFSLGEISVKVNVHKLLSENLVS